MPSQAYSTAWTVFLSASSGDISVGDVVIPNAAGDAYILANAANRTLAVRDTCAGISLTEGDSRNRAIHIQTVGPCPPAITGLAADTASFIIVNDSGRLERKASPADTDIVVGKCDADGWAHLNFASSNPSNASVADDIAKSVGTHIDRVRGFNGVPFVTATGATPADGTAAPIGGTQVYNEARGVAGYKGGRPTPHGWIDPFDYGAVGDGSSHPLSGYFANLAAAQVVYPHATSLSNEIDWAAIQAAINIATVNGIDTGTESRGGNVHIGRGHFICDQPLTMKGQRGLKLSGCGMGVVGALDGCSTLLYTGAGRRFIDFRSTFGCTLENIAIRYSNASFKGHLVDFSHYTDADTESGTVSNVFFGSGTLSFPNYCKSAINLQQAIACTIDRCLFQSVMQGIRGHNNDGGYSNAHTISNCQFVFCKYALTNAGQNWHIHGCTFEGTGGFMEAAYYDDAPLTRATVSVPLVYHGSIISRASGSFIDDGWKIGLNVGSIHGVNVAFFGFSPKLVRVTATELDLSANTITLSGNTITRSYGSFVDDGWTVGMLPYLEYGSLGTQGAISAISMDEKTLTITGAAYGGPTNYTAGRMYHLFEAQFDALTLASVGYTFTDDTSTDALVYGTIDGATFGGGPISFLGCWFGDRFNDGPWIRTMGAASLQLIGNFIDSSGSVASVLDVMLGVSGLQVQGNVMNVNQRPLQLASEGTDLIGGFNIDGVLVQGNFGGGWSTPTLIDWPLGLVARNIIYGGNVGDVGESVVDMDDANATILWSDAYASEIIQVISTHNFSGDRTLTVPFQSSAGAVKRFIRNAQAGAHDVVVSAQGVGTTVNIAQGKGAWVGISTDGVFRMGPDV